MQSGGLVPLLDLLESKHYNLQHNAAFALYGLADNEDNIPDIIRVGALQRLMECSERLSVQVRGAVCACLAARAEGGPAAQRAAAHAHTRCAALAHPVLAPLLYCARSRSRRRPRTACKRPSRAWSRS